MQDIQVVERITRTEERSNHLYDAIVDLKSDINEIKKDREKIIKKIDGVNDKIDTVLIKILENSQKSNSKLENFTYKYLGKIIIAILTFISAALGISKLIN